MSRSRRRWPLGFLATARTSEKQDKRIANRAFRRVSRQLGEAAPVHVREVANVYDFNKDGKPGARWNLYTKDWRVWRK